MSYPFREKEPKRRLAILGLLDGPLYRDWLFWWTLSWVVVGGLSVAFPTPDTEPTTSLPKWLNVIVTMLVMLGVMGLLPAGIRRGFRRYRWSRQRVSGQVYPDRQQDLGVGPAASV